MVHSYISTWYTVESNWAQPTTIRTWNNPRKRIQVFFQSITSTLVVADRGAFRIWRWVSLPEGGQKFWLQWQLVDAAWLACARVAATRSATERQARHQHNPTLFSEATRIWTRFSRVNCMPGTHFHWVICIPFIRWHGAHLQAVVIVMGILLPDPKKLSSSLWVEKLEGVT